MFVLDLISSHTVSKNPPKFRKITLGVYYINPPIDNLTMMKLGSY